MQQGRSCKMVIWKAYNNEAGTKLRCSRLALSELSLKEFTEFPTIPKRPSNGVRTPSMKNWNVIFSMSPLCMSLPGKYTMLINGEISPNFLSSYKWLLTRVARCFILIPKNPNSIWEGQVMDNVFIFNVHLEFLYSLHVSHFFYFGTF
jgi:hypothetical protein